MVVVGWAAAATAKVCTTTRWSCRVRCSRVCVCVSVCVRACVCVCAPCAPLRLPPRGARPSARPSGPARQRACPSVRPSAQPGCKATLVVVPLLAPPTPASRPGPLPPDGPSRKLGLGCATLSASVQHVDVAERASGLVRSARSLASAGTARGGVLHCSMPNARHPPRTGASFRPPPP